MRDDQLTPFEEELARRLSAHNAIDVRTTDSLATARRVMARPRGSGLAAAWMQLRPPVRAALVLAMLAALVVGGVLIGAQLARPPLTSLPSASTQPPPSAAAPTGQPLTGWLTDAAWITDAHGISGAADPLRLRLSTATDGRTVTVAWGTAETERVAGTATIGPGGELDLVTTEDGGGCGIGEAGQYRVIEGEELVNLAVIREDCGARRQFFAQPWVRDLTGTSAGGRGVLDLFVPGEKVLVTLPAAHYLASVSGDAASLTDTAADRTLIVIRNPIGLSDPCSSSGGAKRDVPSTSADFSAYLDTLPGLTVQSVPISIDGKPGLKLTIPTVGTADCPSGRVAEWTPRNAATNTFWFIRQGDTDRLYLVDDDRACAVGEPATTGCHDLFLIQWLGAGVTNAEEQSILDTIVFTPELPTAP